MKSVSLSACGRRKPSCASMSISIVGVVEAGRGGLGWSIVGQNFIEDVKKMRVGGQGICAWTYYLRAS